MSIHRIGCDKTLLYKSSRIGFFLRELAPYVIIFTKFFGSNGNSRQSGFHNQVNRRFLIWINPLQQAERQRQLYFAESGLPSSVEPNCLRAVCSGSVFPVPLQFSQPTSATKPADKSTNYARNSSPHGRRTTASATKTLQ